MKSKILVTGLTSFFLLAVIGCKESMKECNKIAPSLYTIGYKLNQLDTIIITNYIKGSNFQTEIDKHTLCNGDIVPLQVRQDSFLIYLTNWKDYYTEFENFD